MTRAGVLLLLDRLLNFYGMGLLFYMCQGQDRCGRPC